MKTYKPSKELHRMAEEYLQNQIRMHRWKLRTFGEQVARIREERLGLIPETETDRVIARARANPWLKKQAG